MSQRGSFVTEYIYCDKCFQAAKTVLLSRDKGLCSVAVPHWNPEQEGPEMPIIAGKIGGSANSFVQEVGQKLSEAICHPVRIAVLEEESPGADEAAITVVVASRRTQ